MRISYTSSREFWNYRVWFPIQVLAISNFLLPSTAHAYLDPGTGAAIVTAVLGFVAAISYTFRKYLDKLKRVLFGDKSENKEEK